MTFSTPQATSYRVGWICAVTTEYAAACVLLDEEYDSPSLHSPFDDGNLYTCGRIGRLHVVITCLPKGRYGLAAAADVAKDMLRSFPSIQFRLMVGIGGGAPTKKNDIRLGDVVVSVPNGRSGGVIHYEFGKTEQNKEFIPRGHLNSPPGILLHAVQKLASIHMRNGHRIVQTVNNMIRQKPRLESKYGRPPEEKDVLFQSRYLHRDDSSACDNCCSINKTTTVPRPPRAIEVDEGNIVQVHYGIIASADRLMKDAILRDRLAETEDVHCFEMEAAGLMHSFSCLVIRGICDYSDTHKNDIWQGYAAFTAAAYAKELLGVVPIQSTTDSFEVSPASTPFRRVASIEQDSRDLDFSQPWLNSTNRNQHSWSQNPEPLHTSWHTGTSRAGGPKGHMLAYHHPDSTMKEAFHKLRDLVSASDASSFQSTKLEEIWNAAEEIQNSQRQRQSMQAMSRVELFLKRMEGFSRAVEDMQIGTTNLPWVWAPIKLMLQLASQPAVNDPQILNKLLDAYHQLAEAMPNFDRLHGRFAGDTGFPEILAMFYSDILEFHREAYKIFRRRAWPLLFHSTWTSFEARIKCLVSKMSILKDMLTTPSKPIDIVLAKQLRGRANEELEIKEGEQNGIYKKDTFAWLNVQQENQDDELDRLLRKRQSGTCDWVFKHPKYVSWATDAHADRVLWVNGIPGAGKTILCAYIIEKLQQESQTTTAYLICNSYTKGKDTVAETLRSLAVQLLRRNLDILPYAFENYANKAFSASVSNVRRLLLEILALIPNTRICIDGLDEYPQSQQRSILTEILGFARAPGSQCKILICSRDVPTIDKQLRNKPLLSLRDEQSGVDDDIENYLKEYLQDLLERFEGNEHVMNEILGELRLKADGMFLWVRLILEELGKCWSAKEFREAVKGLPKGLGEAYGRVLKRITHEMNPGEQAKAIRILEWLACSCRLMKMHEVQDGIVFYADNLVLNDETKLPRAVLELCKPLIEPGPKNTIDFVHYSAKEYILDRESGPLLQEMRAHYNIAFSCVSYLNTAQCFSQPGTPTPSVQARVAKGLHGLHNYANEYWFQHLLLCSRELVNLDNHGLMNAALQTLQRQFWKDQPGIAAHNFKLDDTTTANEIRQELLTLERLENIQQMGMDIQTFRAHLVQEKHAHEVAEKHHIYEIKNDPTYFSIVSQCYQEVVLFLLTCGVDDLPDGVTAGILETFRTTYGEAEFTCRFHECPYHSEGFNTIQARNNHEITHTKTLRCADPSCEFFARGFSSKTGLQKHNRKYHPSPEDIELPKFEPIRAVDESPSEPPASPPPATPLAAVPSAPPPIPITEVPQLQPEAPDQTEKPSRIPKKTQKRGKRGLRVHNCTTCMKVFMRAEALRRHQLSHQPPGFRCDHALCGKAFHRRDLYLLHMKKHEPQPPDWYSSPEPNA